MYAWEKEMEQGYIRQFSCPYAPELGTLGENTELYTSKDSQGYRCLTVQSEKYGMTFRLESNDWISYATSAGGDCEFYEGSAVMVSEFEDMEEVEHMDLLNSLCDLPEPKFKGGYVWWPKIAVEGE